MPPSAHDLSPHELARRELCDDIAVFSGSAHPAFAERMCASLGIELSPSVTTRFSNDCLQVQLRANCRQRDVYIVQTLTSPVQDHLVELLMMLDAARGASARSITAVIPHYSYARSDKKDAPRISIGARLVADLLATSGASRVLTMALHSPQVHGFFPVPVDHLSAVPELAAHFAGRDPQRTVVVSPDLGGAKVASDFARILGLPMAAGSKERKADDHVTIDYVVGEVAGKDVIILDDEIATAGSIVELLRVLRAEGVGRIAIACTHGLYSGPAVERLRAEQGVEEIVSTDTVPLPEAKRLPQMATVSVTPLFAEAVRRIHCGESVSTLFSDEPTYG